MFVISYSLIVIGVVVNHYFIDGAKELDSAIKKVFKDKTLIQRCQWHKRENVVSYLPKSLQPQWRRKLQQAYENPTYEEARSSLHRLGLFPQLGISLKTNNCIESVMTSVEEYTGKVDHWKNSSQKHRWMASALLEIEPRLPKLKQGGFK